MAARGAKPIFSFLTFAFLMAAIVAGAQAFVQWRHPEALGWIEQVASARSGAWGTWIALGLGGFLGLVCLLLGAYSIVQRRVMIGALGVIFGAALGVAPHLGSPWIAVAAGGSFLLFLVTLKITDVLDRRASSPKAPPTKKAG